MNLGLMSKEWGYRSHAELASTMPTVPTSSSYRLVYCITEEDIKGLALVDLTWIEEAQYVSQASMDLLRPTIRKDYSQILATYNQTFRTDAISKFQVAMKGNPRVWHQHVTYANNEFFTARNDRDRLDDMELNPDQYAHVWEGDFDDLSGDKRFLPYALIQMAVDAYEQGLAPIIPKGAYYEAGLDISDTGPDYNALVVRWGPTIVHASRWHNSDQGATVRKAHEVLLPYMPREGRLYYDSQGVGTGAKVYFNDVLVNRPYTVRPFKFGAVPGGKDVKVDSRSTNAALFARRNAQAWYWLRIRAQNTQRLMNGDKVDPMDCLFIDPQGIREFEEFKAELAQPQWKYDTAMRMVAVKADEKAGERSPDFGDASVMSFAADTERGMVLKYAQFEREEEI